MSEWFKDKVVYQIYPMSFKDSTGSGMGDINGIREKLLYLADLGVDVLWITPIYKSPKRDNGYDIADYYQIDPDFGTMEDFQNLIAEADGYGISIIMDIVANHTSTDHEWFQKALTGDKRYMDYYVFKDEAFTKEHAITSVFGGGAWEYVPHLDKYYLHIFDKTQADLNWDNEEVRAEIYKMINFWLDKGVKGFRFDVIDTIAKVWEKNQMANGPTLHPYIKEMTAATFGKLQDTFTVGESWSADLEGMKQYSNPDGSELSMVFNFEHLCYTMDKWTAKMEKPRLKHIFEKLQKGLYNKGWNSLFLSNHDLPRAIERFGDSREEYREISAKQWALIFHMLQGTPYIYQGEEIGMTNREWKFEELRDIEAINFYNERVEKEGKASIFAMLKEISRDNARTPMQWDDSDNAGFSSSKPWIVVNENYKEINVKEAMTRYDSIFYFYKRLIELRKTLRVIIDGTFELLNSERDDLLCYVRENIQEKIFLFANLTDKPVDMPMPIEAEEGMLLMSSYEENFSKTFRPYETVAIFVPKYSEYENISERVSIN